MQTTKSMPEPKTIRYWLDRRYSFIRKGDCPACGVPVEFWRTPAGDREVPLDPETLEPHFSQCSQARNYRTEQRMKVGAL